MRFPPSTNAVAPVCFGQIGSARRGRDYRVRRQGQNPPCPRFAVIRSACLAGSRRTWRVKEKAFSLRRMRSTLLVTVVAVFAAGAQASAFFSGLSLSLEVPLNSLLNYTVFEGSGIASGGIGFIEEGAGMVTAAEPTRDIEVEAADTGAGVARHSSH